MEIPKSKRLKEKIIQKIKLEPDFLSLTSLVRTSKITFQENTVVFAASGRYNFKIAEQNFALLKKIITDLDYKDFKLVESVSAKAVPQNVPIITQKKPHLKKEIFNDFHPYEGVQNAFRAISSITENRSQGQLFPIFLYGNPGIGKTHLLNLAARNLGDTAFTSDEFTQKLVSSVEKKDLNGFKSSFFSESSLLIDDIQKFIGRKRTLQEFFNIFDSFLARSRPIVVVADRHPRTINEFSPRLISRLTAGLVIKMSPPLEAEREALLSKIIKEKNSDVIPVNLFQKLPPDVRALKGIATRFLWSKSIGNPEEYSVSFALSMDTSLPGSSLLDEVCNVFNVSKSSLLSGVRSREVVLARQAASILLCGRPNGCKASSSRVLNVKKSAITYSLKKGKEKLKKDSFFKDQVKSIAINHGISLGFAKDDSNPENNGNFTLFEQ